MTHWYVFSTQLLQCLRHVYKTLVLNQMKKITNVKIFTRGVKSLTNAANYNTIKRFFLGRRFLHRVYVQCWNYKQATNNRCCTVHPKNMHVVHALCFHWNENVVILTKVSSLAALKVVIFVSVCVVVWSRLILFVSFRGNFTNNGVHWGRIAIASVPVKQR